MEQVLTKIFIAGLVTGLSCGAALALECPKLQPLDAKGTTPDLTKQLATKDVLSQVPGVLGALKEQFPAVGKPMLVNYVIAAYCPVVKADAGLSEQEKDAKLREFADKVVSSAF